MGERTADYNPVPNEGGVVREKDPREQELKRVEEKKKEQKQQDKSAVTFTDTQSIPSPLSGVAVPLAPIITITEEKPVETVKTDPVIGDNATLRQAGTIETTKLDIVEVKTKEKAIEKEKLVLIQPPAPGPVIVLTPEPKPVKPPKLVEPPKPVEEKTVYKMTVSKGGLGLRQVYDESPVPLSEFVKKQEKTVDCNPAPDQGGSTDKNTESPIPLSNFVKQEVVKDKGILIIRSQGGVGDLLNSRMIFEDIKKMAKGRKVTYAVPQKYLSLLKNHPYIDNVIPTYDIVRKDYSFCKNITDQCGKYEVRKIPFVDKHRSDIWANYIGLELTNHNQHLRFTREEVKQAKARMGRAKLKVGIQPISANISKDWGLIKWQELVNRINQSYKGTKIFCYHNKPIDEFKGVTGMYDLSLPEWMASVNECDIIVTVATAMFCLAGGLHKPTVAIFGSEDLDIYGKYFPEMVLIQRHRKNNDGWENCPCWSAWRDCKKGSDITINNQKIPPCLESITVDEVMKGFEQCLQNLGRIISTENTLPSPGKKDGIMKRLFN